jgi:hypothetical protein
MHELARVVWGHALAGMLKIWVFEIAFPAF